MFKQYQTTIGTWLLTGNDDYELVLDSKGDEKERREYNAAVLFDPTGLAVGCPSSSAINCSDLSLEKGNILFCNIYKMIRKDYVDDVPGETLFEGAQKGIRIWLANKSTPQSETEGIADVANESTTDQENLPELPFYLKKNQLKGESDQEKINRFFSYMNRLVHNKEIISIFENSKANKKVADQKELTDSKNDLSYQLFIAAIEGMFLSLEDPHSRLLSDFELRELQTTVAGSFGGLGMYVNKRRIADRNKQYIEVISPIEATPAYYAGIHAGDFISFIGKKSTVPMSLDEAVSLMRGQPGTSITITLIRGEKSFESTLTRARIKVPTIKKGLIEPQEIRNVLRINTDKPVVYAHMLLFTPNLKRELESALKEYLSQDVAGIVLDLRGNGGGLLRSAIDVTDLFFDDGRIVSLRGRNRKEEIFYEARTKKIVDNDIPIIILVNKSTASASEIFSGAMKDRSRAILVGSTTYGKGSVQHIYMFDNNSVGIRLTTDRYYTPNGISIDKKGIVPDYVIEVKYTDEEKEAFDSFLKNDELSDLIGKHSETEIPEKTVSVFIETMLHKYPGLNKDLFSRFVWQEVYRINKNTSKSYDLRFDRVLREAIPHIFNKK
ncbi:hypothetical protein LSH36_583g01277 [Paralvinella palmiformis]|uniref:Uncharacterized protein n=1 Tax=Paralvinella palmiformis TaxID=53620 RepID=A0AAD9MWW7_9ANNE|nr:hypothetical protein LSH36_583g01277 [Paralvinella palmiformis]